MSEEVVVGKYNHDVWIRTVAPGVQLKSMNDKQQSLLLKELTKIDRDFVIRGRADQGKCYAQSIDFLDVSLKDEPVMIKKSLLESFVDQYFKDSKALEIKRTPVSVEILEKSFNEEKGAYRYVCGKRLER